MDAVVGGEDGPSPGSRLELVPMAQGNVDERAEPVRGGRRAVACPQVRTVVSLPHGGEDAALHRPQLRGEPGRAQVAETDGPGRRPVGDPELRPAGDVSCLEEKTSADA